jgi:hypothetical protein
MGISCQEWFGFSYLENLDGNCPEGGEFGSDLVMVLRRA